MIPIAGGHVSPQKRKRSFDSRNIIIVLLAIIALAAVVVAVWALKSGGRGETPAVPAQSAAPEPTPTQEPLRDQIALPQFAWLSLKADMTEQTLTFDNPGRNFAAFRVSIVLDGETLWESETLKPGDTSAPVVLSRPLAKGVYEANLVYTCFTNDEAQNPLNGANSPVPLKVN